MMGGLNASAGFDQILWPRIWQGFALGFLFVPLTTVTLAEIPRATMSNATGLYTLVRQLGGGFGIAILQLLQQRHEDSAYAVLASGVTSANPMDRAFMSAGHSAQQLLGIVQQNAAMLSYDDLFQLCGIIFLISIPTVFLLKTAKPAAGDPVVIAD
jgi:DHA2 family multidrug resistance protein